MTHGDEPHVIRLRGPWLCAVEDIHTTPEYETSMSPWFDVRLPARTGSLTNADYRGQLELLRRFNWPEPLGYRESLWVVVQTAAWPRFTIELNDRPLGAVEDVNDLPAAWDISPCVKAHNELLLAWKIDAPAILRDLSWVEVQLEVRSDVGPRN